jgi:predicted pyridoxine 5'-phosphate oxidase superfamily flavin-nucleotide-binding protein
MTAPQQHAPTMYGPGSRALQESFDSTRLANRLEERLAKDTLEDWQIGLIENASFFMLSTVDADGWPDVSYKGGAPGFVKVIDGQRIVFPSYDGNGMFRSVGNIMDTGKVAMLFISFDNPARTRIHGTAQVHLEKEWLDRFPSADAVVEVRIGRAFPNCPRYIHNMATGQLAPSTPREGHTVEEAEWKTWPEWNEVLPNRNR